MDYERSHNTSRRAPKLTTPALAKAYGELSKKEKQTGELPAWRKTCATCGAYYAPYCYGIELMDGCECELETPYTTEPDSWCTYWQREPKTEWNGRPCGRKVHPMSATDKQLVKTELDCWHERYAICPWCGYEDHDSWEYQEGKTDTECPSCGKPITVTVKSEVTYTTEPIGGWPDERD